MKNEDRMKALAEVSSKRINHEFNRWFKKHKDEFMLLSDKEETLRDLYLKGIEVGLSITSKAIRIATENVIEETEGDKDV